MSMSLLLIIFLLCGRSLFGCSLCGTFSRSNRMSKWISPSLQWLLSIRYLYTLGQKGKEQASLEEYESSYFIEMEVIFFSSQRSDECRCTYQGSPSQVFTSVHYWRRWARSSKICSELSSDMFYRKITRLSSTLSSPTYLPFHLKYP